MNRIPVVMITDDNYVMQTSVAITSLIKSKNLSTQYEILVVMAECSEKSEKILCSMETEDCKITIVPASLEQYKDIRQMAHISIACLLKFDICELIPQYDKLLYMDGDVIVRKDLSEFYATELEDNYAAGVKEIYYINEDNGCINAGIMLFHAKKMRDDGMRDILVAKRRSLGNRSSMDQQTYNIVIKDKIKYVSIAYNCVPGRLVGDVKMDYTMERINKFYGTDYKTPQQIIDDAAIWHFATGNKPWKYTFAPGAKEWYQCYLQSPFGKEPFKRYGRWEYRLHNLKQRFQKEGINGIVNLMKERSQRKKRGRVDWD